MKYTLIPQKPNESGNAIWFVLLVIVLLAALTITVTRSSDTTEQSGDIEQYRIQASRIMNAAHDLERAIDQMRMRGISESDLCFHDSGWGHTDYNSADCSNAENVIYSVAGGGLTFSALPNVIGWDIAGSHAVQDVESSANDLILQAQVKKGLCLQMNKMLGIANPSGDAPVDDASPVARFAGSYASAAADNLIGNAAAGLAGQKSGCRKDAAGDYYFYHVLIAR